MVQYSTPYNRVRVRVGNEPGGSIWKWVHFNSIRFPLTPQGVRVFVASYQISLWLFVYIICVRIYVRAQNKMQKKGKKM